MVKIGKTKIKKSKPIMSFGKYEGEYLEDIPTDYLEWLYNQPGFKNKRPTLAKQIQAILLDDEKGNNFSASEYDDFDDDYFPGLDNRDDDDIPW